MRSKIEYVINNYDIYLKHKNMIYLLEAIGNQSATCSIKESMQNIENYYYKTDMGNLRMLKDKISVDGFISNEEFVLNCIKYKYRIR